MAERTITTNQTDQVVTVRMPGDLTDAIRHLAKRESESQATVFRRLVREALAQEHSRDQTTRARR